MDASAALDMDMYAVHCTQIKGMYLECLFRSAAMCRKLECIKHSAQFVKAWALSMFPKCGFRLHHVLCTMERKERVAGSNLVLFLVHQDKQHNSFLITQNFKQAKNFGQD